MREQRDAKNREEDAKGRKEIVMHVAVITGASMGLGEEFARQLAARGENLLLVARSGERMEALAAELTGRYGVAVHVFPCDLAAPGAAAAIEEYLAQQGLAPAWLINNAGLGDAGPFEAMEPGRLAEQLTVNVVALTELTRRLLPALRQANGARIINIASRTAFQPVPFFAVYSAGKAYVLSFSEALHEELRGTGVRVTCLCPGPTDTGFNENNAIRSRKRHGGQSAAEVARMGLEGSDRGRAVVICQGWWTILAQRLLPRDFVCRMAGRITRRDKHWEE